jgi:vancomycin permeability regulator SanA
MGRLLVRLTIAGLVLAAPPAVWLRLASAGHVHTVESAPDAPVVIVFGAQLDGGGNRPSPFLAYRLDTAIRLVAAGKARAVLVSGDADGGSGDEVSVMNGYLLAHGVPQQRVVVDGYGLDTYDTCRRAHDVYGVRRALLVSQALHLPRAVTLCRTLGVDAEGVAAPCECPPPTWAYNNTRELAAGWKAVYDVVSGRPAAVRSEPTDALARALQD